jgi:glycosyltransferase involved in cell wall biosynthesis
VNVVLVANTLGLGGTEKALQTHALHFDRERLQVRVVAALEDGPRRAPLERGGVQVDCAGGDAGRLADLLAGVDVVHVFRGGVAEPLVPDACRRAGVGTIVESNVFGAVDASGDERTIACHLFPGKMVALRYRRRLGLGGADFHERHRVSHWPVDIDALRALAPSTEEAKSELGLDPARPVVGRIGRDNDRKWRNLLVDMVEPLARLAPDLQVLFVGATPSKIRGLDRAGMLDRVHLGPPTADDERLALIYAACDVYVTAAEIGESFSYAIEEAMALGLPVVTCSTPWVDNGQIEQVDEAVTGHVSDHPVAMAEAIASLAADPGKHAAFAAASRAKAEQLFEARALTRQLEALYEGLLSDGRPPAEWSPSPAELDAFALDYERRLEAGYRPLTGQEQHEVQAARLRERATWAARAARSGLDPEVARYAYWALRARIGQGP